jgi:hypothetical protein
MEGTLSNAAVRRVGLLLMMLENHSKKHSALTPEDGFGRSFCAILP